jgi:phage FluMu gp28-like protein
MRPLLGAHQLAWIADRSKIKLGVMCRRAGKDWGSAAGKVIDRLEGRSLIDCNFISTKEEKAKEYIAYCAEFCRLAGTVVEVVSGTELFGRQEIQTWKITFPAIKGRKPVIRALSSAPDDARGYDGDIVLSEFAFYADPRRVYDAAAPCTTLGGSIEILTTPNMEGDFTEELREMGRRRAAGCPKPNDLPISYHEADVNTIATNGYLDVINRNRGTALTPEQFVADCRAMCRTQEAFDREFLLRASADAGSYFPMDMLRPLVSEKAAKPTGEIGRFLADVASGAAECDALHAGCDVGRRKDLFVISVRAKIGGMRRLVGALRFTGRPFADMEMAINGLMAMRIGDKGRMVSRLSIDETGMGMQVAENMRRKWGYRVEPRTFNPTLKTDLATLARTVVEDKSIDLPDDAQWIGAYNAIRRTVTGTNVVRFDGESEVGHVDEFWADALCIDAGKRGSLARGVDFQDGVDS